MLLRIQVDIAAAGGDGHTGSRRVAVIPLRRRAGACLLYLHL